MQPVWLKINVAARYAGVSPRTLRGWLRQGLKCSRLPTGLVLIPVVELDNYLRGFEVSSDKSVKKIVDKVISEFQH